MATLRPMKDPGVSNKYAPPTSTLLHPSVCSDLFPESSATSDAEQAESIVMLGPLRPNANEIRLAEILSAPPTAENDDADGANSPHSLGSYPTKHPVHEPIIKTLSRVAATAPMNPISRSCLYSGAMAFTSAGRIPKNQSSKI